MLIEILSLSILILFALIVWLISKNNKTSQLETNFISHLHDNQIKSASYTQEIIGRHMHDIREQIDLTLKQNADFIGKNIDKLTIETERRLTSISGQVDKRLTEGFEKTTATFTDVVKRLALIDEAQKKITELSTNVVGLQDLLNDKRSRGAFGEVQLNGLIRNMLPEQHFSLQHTLTNGKRADCILFLPDPTGNIVVDAKFPLENYRISQDSQADKGDKKAAELRFKQDIRKHINDITSKYIIKNETSDGAMMFIPAEAIFAEIHANHPELVEYANRARVWMVSPTTIMAILTTARAVIKDAATREQVHIIQAHLAHLAKDFQRFEKRMDNLARHIEQAHKDVNDVNTSAKKITSRFAKIENAELDTPSNELIDRQ